jgi:hypothetical protein
MSKNPDQDVELEELDFEDDEDVSAEEDYGFIIGADGTIKHIFAPDEFDLQPPAVVRKILKVLGIKDINQLGIDGYTVH